MMDRKELLTSLSAGVGVTLTPALLTGLLSSCKNKDSHTAVFTEQDDQLLRQLGDIILPRTTTPGAIDVKAQDYVNAYIKNVIDEDTQKTFYKNYSSWKAQFTMRHRTSAEKADKDTLQKELSQRFDVSNDIQEKVLKKDPSIGQENLNCYAFLLMFKKLTMIGYYLSEEIGEKHLSYLPVPGPYKSDVPTKDIGNSWSLG